MTLDAMSLCKNAVARHRASLLMLSFALVVLISITPTSCNAHLLVEPVDVDHLLEGSDLVILGDVIHRRVEEVDYTAVNALDERRYEQKAVFTIYTLSVANVLAGEWPKSEIEVYTLGGNFDGWATDWPSMSMSLADQERYVLFLKESEANDFWYAFEQRGGVFKLIANGEATEVRGLDDEKYLNTGNQGHESAINHRNSFVATLVRKGR